MSYYKVCEFIVISQKFGGGPDYPGAQKLE